MIFGAAGSLLGTAMSHEYLPCPMMVKRLFEFAARILSGVVQSMKGVFVFFYRYCWCPIIT